MRALPLGHSRLVIQDPNTSGSTSASEHQIAAQLDSTWARGVARLPCRRNRQQRAWWGGSAARLAHLGRGLVRDVQQDVRVATAAHLGLDGARHHVARRQLQPLVVARHEALAACGRGSTARVTPGLVAAPHGGAREPAGWTCLPPDGPNQLTQPGIGGKSITLIRKP